MTRDQAIEALRRAARKFRIPHLAEQALRMENDLRLHLTDGSVVELDVGEYVEMEQDARGRFVRVLDRGRY
jgi:ferric-dicitrate binding protein FerR (iron transport regulator)